MQHNVGIGVTRDAAPVRDTNSSKPDVIPVAELVNVGAEPGANIAERGEVRLLGARKILRRGELHVGGLAFEGRDRHASPFGERGVIGEVVAGGRLRAPVRLEDRRKAKGLRRLHGAKLSAVEGAGDARRRVHGLDRVGERQHRHRRTALLRRGNRAGDQGGRRKRPRRIVDQHDVGLVRGHRFKPGPY